MRHRWWIAALSTVAILGLALPSQALGGKGLLRRGEKKKQQQDQIGSCIRQRAWIAYFQDDEGQLSPARDTLNTEEDEDWIGLRFTPYDGPRIRLGVLKVINKSAESEERGWADRIEVPVSGIQEMLTVALYNTKRFDVIEQKRVEEVEAQQKRTDVIEPSPAAIVNMGKVLGAQYLVYGTVNEWNPERASRSMGPASLFKAGKKEAEVAITFTLTDVANGQILFTTSERARLGEWSFGFGAPGGGGETTQKTPVSYAVHACANKAALKIATFLRDRKWKGSVVDIKGADYYINAGSQQGMAPQTKLAVQSFKGFIKDAGTILGEDLRGIGTLEVIVVQPGFSIARVVEGCKGIKKGDRVELATNPVPPPTIPECVALDTSQAL
jgi:curli biogenesis system outer membrane secretion channel CsgG